MDEILLLLLRKGAHERPLRLTTSEIGIDAGMSQQNASNRLIQLEKEGLIERGKDGISLTKKGFDSLASGYATLKTAFEGGKIEFEGTIAKGLGEGGYYVSMEGYSRQMKEKLGFAPFPGTLNLKLDDQGIIRRQQMLKLEPVIISGFKDEKRTYGDLFAFKCRIESEECAVIVPIRTHHGPEIIEVVCPFNIKKKLGKKDGDKVKVSLC
jgi:riboflavin kinase